jgi:hypothetical protein
MLRQDLAVSIIMQAIGGARKVIPHDDTLVLQR